MPFRITPRPVEAARDRGEARRIRRRRWRRLPILSPLTRKLLAVNLLAPVLLALGLLFLDHYREVLLQSETENLRRQAAMVADALSEGAIVTQFPQPGEADPTGEVPETRSYMVPEVALHMLWRMAARAETRARLFSSDGGMVADSRLTSGPGGVLVMNLPPPDDGGEQVLGLAERLYRSLFALDWGQDLPLYPDAAHASADAFEEVRVALGGDHAQSLRRRADGTVMISVAVPVQYYKRVAGVVLMSEDTAALDQALYEVRTAMLQVFAGVLALTVLVSLYLAKTITRPIQRLSIAAEQVRQGHPASKGREEPIPDLSDRLDEIGDLSSAMHDMTEALWSRMDAIERFAADVAHEIKNPLTSIRSAIETAQRITDLEKRDRLLAIVVSDVGRIDRLISDISDASRIDAELSRGATSPVDMAGMLKVVVDVTQVMAERENVKLALDLPEGDPLTVQGLEDRLVQLLRNLIGNGLSFSPDGGTLTLSGRRENGDVLVLIEDEGPGIPEGKEDAIFARFYTERPEDFGTHSGLGLSISRQIAEAHGGTLIAGNRETGGAWFRLGLPAET